MFFFFFFNDTATTEIYTLSLHDALPICWRRRAHEREDCRRELCEVWKHQRAVADRQARSEEHTSELQSQSNLVCRLLLEKKKKRHQRFSVGDRHHLPLRYRRRVLMCWRE